MPIFRSGSRRADAELIGDAGAVEAWLEAALELQAPITLKRIHGGNSNLTYRVNDAANRRVILRRGPHGAQSGHAHDILREFAVLSALKGSAVPVPDVYALCDDDTIGPFYAMEAVDGIAVKEDADVEPLRTKSRCRAGSEVIDALISLHRVDSRDIEIRGARATTGYMTRQIDRWQEQFDRAQDGRVDEASEVVHGVAAELRRRLPTGSEVRLIHGDYGLHNCLIRADGSLGAVIDWELSTFGDPLADLALLLAYWTDPEDSDPAFRRGPTRLDGFPRRAQLLERYATQSGCDISQIDDYVAFAHWKLACVFAGVAYRFREGELAHDREKAARFQANVLRVARRSAFLLAA